MYNLTDAQKTLIKWLVQSVREEKLSEEFTIVWQYSGSSLSPAKAISYEYSEHELPVTVTPGALDTLSANGLLISIVRTVF
jgi:hypothetical protein